MLEARKLCKVFGGRGQTKALQGVEAVKNVSFTLESGIFYALIGESGSGKSTLCQLLLGLLAPTSGEVLLNGKRLSVMNKQQKKQVFATVQLVLQDAKSALDPRFTVQDSLLEPMRHLHRLGLAEAHRQMRELMHKMELPASYLLRKPHELSGGEQKRVCIARALAASPRIILFDEAVSGQDVIARKSILDLLIRLHREDALTLLLVTHDMAAALYAADYLFVMKDGEIVESGSCRQGSPDLTHPYTRLLLDTSGILRTENRP